METGSDGKNEKRKKEKSYPKRPFAKQPKGANTTNGKGKALEATFGHTLATFSDEKVQYCVQPTAMGGQESLVLSIRYPGMFWRCNGKSLAHPFFLSSSSFLHSSSSVTKRSNIICSSRCRAIPIPPLVFSDTTLFLRRRHLEK